MFLVSGHSTLVRFTQAVRTNVQENLEGNLETKKTLDITLVRLTSVRLTSVQENREGSVRARNYDYSYCGAKL